MAITMRYAASVQVQEALLPRMMQAARDEFAEAGLVRPVECSELRVCGTKRLFE